MHIVKCATCRKRREHCAKGQCSTCYARDTKRRRYAEDPAFAERCRARARAAYAARKASREVSP